VPSQNENPVIDMINDVFGMNKNDDVDYGAYEGPSEFVETMTNEEYVELLRDCNLELYEGCQKYLKLSFILRLYHIKCLCRMTSKAMTMILKLLTDAFEYGKFPTSFYKAKKVIQKLGLNYTKIDVCLKNCMLYWEKMKNWRIANIVINPNGRKKGTNGKKKLPVKVLHYFPLKPRLQRLFMSPKTTKSMRWHILNNNPDGLLRHPRDGKAWKSFDQLHLEFAIEPRNVCLGLATDGFNPYRTMNNGHSIWPMILIPYNRPPWECMKQSSFIVSMIIPGRKKMPGNKIVVYLQPLVKELNELWTEGVETYDSFSNEVFVIRASLMWTISDFPGLCTLSRWNTYTSYACPHI